MPERLKVAETGLERTRGGRYVELFAVGDEVVTVYNSSGLGTAPPSPELWEGLDSQAAAEQLGVGTVVKNGPHWWAFDSATMSFGVDVVTVQGIGFRFAAELPALVARSGKLTPPVYTVVETGKEGEQVYLAGEPVYELVSPEGEAFVMQSSNVGPGEYGSLGERLSPAPGWSFRTRIPEEDLTVALDGHVKTVMDDFHDVYNLA